MSLLLYGITDSGPALPDTGQGVGGASVRRIGSGGLVAIATEHGRSPAFDEEALWAFEQVVESHMTDGAILPIRFGTLLPDAAATERMLRERRTEFSDKLERIRGAVELSVRGIWPAIPDATIAGAETGTGYMRSRAEPRRRAREIAARVHARLDGHARDSHHRLLTDAHTPVTAAFLVDRETEQDFLCAVQGLDAQLAEADLVCTGPWPAYSFVGGPLND